MMRLNKYISQCGIASRRKADELIRSGKVRINGEVVTALGTQVNLKKDSVFVNGKRCVPRATHTYVALHKPRGYVCTHARFVEEKSIFELLPEKYSKLKIAGRLDKESGGLVVLSDDGTFVNRLIHPRFRHEKEYQVELDSTLSAQDIRRLHKGVRLTEGIARADRIHNLKGTTYTLVLHQGWKRQIRRMMGLVRHHVIQLKRVRIAGITLGGMPSGEYRTISSREIKTGRT